MVGDRGGVHARRMGDADAALPGGGLIDFFVPGADGADQLQRRQGVHFRAGHADEARCDHDAGRLAGIVVGRPGGEVEIQQGEVGREVDAVAGGFVFEQDDGLHGRSLGQMFVGVGDGRRCPDGRTAGPSASYIPYSGGTASRSGGDGENDEC